MLEESIKKAIREKRAIIGYRESIRFIKKNKPKLVVIAKNIPDDKRKEIEYLVRLGKYELKVFDGTSKELGIICGKPFPISILVIRR